MTQLVVPLHVILVEILCEEDEDVDEKFVWDSADGMFVGFKLSETRLDQVDLRLDVVEEGEKMSFMALSGFKPPTKGAEPTVGMLPSGHCVRQKREMVRKQKLDHVDPYHPADRRPARPCTRLSSPLGFHNHGCVLLAFCTPSH